MRTITHHFRQVSLVAKVTLGMGLVLAVGIAVAGFLAFRSSETILIEDLSRDMKSTVELCAHHFEREMQDAQSDLRQVPHLPGVAAYFRARENGGVDPLSGMTSESWARRLELQFQNMVRHKGYFQIRLLDLDTDGHELIRVDGPRHSGDDIRIVRGDDLQAKGNRDYYRAGLELGRGEIHCSHINLNREHGVIETPWRPTARLVTPVYLEGEAKEPTPVALCVINLHLEKAIHESIKSSPYPLIMFNDQGGILQHPDPRLCWQFEISPGTGLKEAEPGAWEYWQSGDQGVAWDASRSQVFIRHDVDLGGHGVHFLLAPRREEIMQDIDRLRAALAYKVALSLLLAMGLAALMGKRLIRPINILAGQAEELASGRREALDIPTEAGEVGRLGRSLNDLIGRLQERQMETEEQAREIRDLNISLEEKVLQRTFELESSHLRMTRSAKTREALNRILQISLTSRSSEELLDGALDFLLGLEFLALEQEAAAYILAEGAGALQMVSERNLSPHKQILCREIPLGHCLCGKAAVEGNIIFKPNLDEDHEIQFEGIADHGHYVVPLRLGERTMGVLALQIPCGRPHIPGEEEFLLSVGQVLAGALARLEMEKDLRASKEAVEKTAADLDQARRQAVAASRSKSAFLANMSHEIRTPMTAILGYTDMLAEPNLSPADHQDFLKTIRQNGRHLLTIINDILDLSKIEAGKMEVESIPISVWEVVEDVIDLLEVRAREKGLALKAVYRYPLPRLIESDPVRLRQILLNLLGNSIKFTREGEVSVTVSRNEDTAAGHLRFEIRDTGIGMSEEQVRGLFQPFQQADATTTRNFGGTGLGLSISRRLSQLMGGDIGVQSEEGRGSCFTVEIDPGALGQWDLVSARPADTGEKPATVVEEDTGRRGRLLLVEDTAVNRKLASRFLTKAGHEVVCANDGKEGLDEALARLHEGIPYDVILMDMQMPVMDGYEATTRLREAGYTLPIVALTANAMASDREKCLQAGCDDFATKPFRRKELLAAINHWIQQAPNPQA